MCYVGELSTNPFKMLAGSATVSTLIVSAFKAGLE